ncbi:MAG: low temperature requirement protein A [Acidimicrobiales bacterium]
MALTKWQPPILRHLAHDNERVSWLELFFDLVYVAALIQLGDRLAGDISWTGVGRFVGAFTVLWWTWTGTTAFVNRFAVDDVIHRSLTFFQMFAVGSFAVIASAADANWPVWLPVAYIAARIPLLAMYARVRATVEEARAVTTLFLASIGGSAAAFGASLLFPTPLRYWIWALALAGEFTLPLLLRRAEGPPIHDEHFQERYALFTIIVLGETFVKTLSEITAIGISVQTQAFGALTFVMLVAIWWTYFDDVADAHIRPQSILSSNQATNRVVWIYSHLPLAAAITAYGVAAKKLVGVEAFADSLKASYTWLLVGALVTILLCVALLDLVTATPHYAIDVPARVGPRVAAAIALMPAAWLTATGSISAIVGASLICAVVVAQIAAEIGIALRLERRLNRQVLADLTDLHGSCEHLTAIQPAAVVGTATHAAHSVCKPCQAKGVQWVQLRVCMTCGYVGCCDDTPGRHATTHYQETGHPVMTTLEPGDDWAYCYEHDIVDLTWQQPADR